eukprot:m.211564 g.211564  ORF g.211564 m.211564 type:complete len:492 (-) comp33104_c4_seq50:265-1740(-)
MHTLSSRQLARNVIWASTCVMCCVSPLSSSPIRHHRHVHTLKKPFLANWSNGHDNTDGVHCDNAQGQIRQSLETWAIQATLGKANPLSRKDETLWFNKVWAKTRKEQQIRARPPCSLQRCFNYSRCLAGKFTVQFLHTTRVASDILAVSLGFDVPETPTALPCLAVILCGNPWGSRVPETHPNASLRGLIPAARCGQKHWDKLGSGENTLVWMESDLGDDDDFLRHNRRQMPVKAAKIMYALSGSLMDNHRLNFDVSTALYPLNTDALAIDPRSSIGRKFFLAFKGSVPTATAFSGWGSERIKLMQLDSFYCEPSGRNDGDAHVSPTATTTATAGNHTKDVVVLLTCQKEKRTEMTEFALACDILDTRARAHTYEDIMFSTFCLVPAGRQPATYRLAEALRFGCIPVITGSLETPLPFQGLIPWHDCVVLFPSNRLGDLVPILRAISPEQRHTMRMNCVHAFENYFKDFHTILRSTIDVVQRRVMGLEYLP